VRHEDVDTDYSRGIGDDGACECDPCFSEMQTVEVLTNSLLSIPDLARSIGQSMNEFRKAREDIDRELHDVGKSSSTPSNSSNSAAQGASRSDLI
jgi:hypothetical protein